MLVMKCPKCSDYVILYSNIRPDYKWRIVCTDCKFSIGVTYFSLLDSRRYAERVDKAAGKVHAAFCRTVPKGFFESGCT